MRNKALSSFSAVFCLLIQVSETGAISVCGKMEKLHYIHNLLVLNLLIKINKKVRIRIRGLAIHKQSRRTHIMSSHCLNTDYLSLFYRCEDIGKGIYMKIQLLHEEL